MSIIFERIIYNKFILIQAYRILENTIENPWLQILQRIIKLSLMPWPSKQNFSGTGK